MRTRWILVLLAVGGLATASALALLLVPWRPRPTTSTTEPTPPVTADTDTGPPYFSDQTERTTIKCVVRTGEEADQYTILESLGAGVALLDYDRDGRLDVFLAGGGYFDGPDKRTLKGAPCKLYRNLGDWNFKDVTADAGLEREWFYNHGVAVADYDRDGWPDLVVTGYRAITLFRNDGGRFKDVSEQVGLADNSWGTSAGWGDIDGDGYPDLYVCHYLDWSWDNNPECAAQTGAAARDVCPPQKFKPLRHTLFRNEQGKRFRDVSAEHNFKPTGCGLGVVLVDVNDDARPDVFVANDASFNFLYFNRDGKLDEQGALSGADRDEEGNYDGSMGIDAADFDGSGRAGLWVTNYQREYHALHRNLGNESLTHLALAVGPGAAPGLSRVRGNATFLHQSRVTGIAAIGTNYVGFGTAFLDVDGDGWEDIAVVNGHVLRHPTLNCPVKQKPVLFRNVKHEGKRFFKDATARGGAYFKKPDMGRGLAVGDLDNDGRPDLVVTHGNSPAVILRNETGAAKESPPWLGVRLVGKDNRDVVGSTVVCRVGDRTLTRFAKGGGSYLSANDPRILFGLGDVGPAERLSVTVKWSWGKTETFDGLEPGRYWELHEGGKAK